MNIEEVDKIDLEYIVYRLRKASVDRAKIPVHSGKASSKKRKENRLERRRLSQEIKTAEAEIVAWALAIVPVNEENNNEDPGRSVPDTDGEPDTDGGGMSEEDQ